MCWGKKTAQETLMFQSYAEAKESSFICASTIPRFL
jgi:hypothetical protein